MKITSGKIFMGIILLAFIYAKLSPKQDEVYYPKFVSPNDAASVPAISPVESQIEDKKTNSLPDTVISANGYTPDTTQQSYNNYTSNDYPSKDERTIDSENEKINRYFEQKKLEREMEKLDADIKLMQSNQLDLNTPVIPYSTQTYQSTSYQTNTYSTQSNISPTYSAPSTYVNPNSNPNTVEVHGYPKANGTYVAPYTRTAPNSTKTDNFSYHR